MRDAAGHSADRIQLLRPEQRLPRLLERFLGIGFSKPSPSAFYRVVERFSLSNADSLMVGDSPELDYDAALNAGLAAVLLDREDRHSHTGRTCILSLADLLSR